MNRPEVRERLVASRDKSQEDYDKVMNEFQTWQCIWEALEAIRENAMKEALNEAIKNLDKGMTLEGIMDHINAEIAKADHQKERRTQMNFPSADLLEDEYIRGGIKRARVRIKRAINPDVELVPTIHRVAFNNPFEIPPNESRLIQGITFTHEYDRDGDPKSNIYVEKGEFSASLTCANDTGEWTGRDDPRIIPPADLKIIQKVYDWWVDSEY